MADLFSAQLLYIMPSGEFVRVSLPILIVIAVLLGIFVVFLLKLIQKRAIGRLEKKYQTLKERHFLLSHIYDLIPDLIFSKDLDGKYTSCNTAFEKFIGAKEETLVGHKDSDFFHDIDMANKFIDDDKKVISSRKKRIIEEEIVYPDGTRTTVETIKLPLYHNDQALGLVGISRDVAARKKAEDDALASSRAKSFFLAQMSHELRTPLNAIIGMSQTARNNLDNREKLAFALPEILSASRHLLNVINQILDMSMIEHGKLKLNPVYYRTKDAFAEVNTIILPICQQKGITYISNFDDCPNTSLYFDNTRLSQVVINLLGNSIKFTPSGGTVTFSFTIPEEYEDHVLGEFVVTDTGIGMTEEQILKVFSPFDQADDSIHSKYGGTGLGLAISQAIIRLMGGEIEVKSSPGKGSTFRFVVRMQKSGEQPAPVQEREKADIRLQGKRILLVDDVEINRIIVAEAFSGTGVLIDEAQDGEEALARFQGAGTGYYSVILMDVQMPRMDGYEATRRIRALDNPYAREIPIIAMTAHAYAEDEANAKAAGMTEHIAKPIDIEELRQTVSALCAD